MGGENDGNATQTQTAGEAQGGEAATQRTQVMDGAGSDDGATAHTGYEMAIKERDDKIAALESEIAEAAERLRSEMDELRRQSDEQRIGFELQMAGCRSVREARPPG